MVEGQSYIICNLLLCRNHIMVEGPSDILDNVL